MSHPFTRREFLRNCALGSAALASGALVGCAGSARTGTAPSGPAAAAIPLNRGWRFGGQFSSAMLKPDYDDSRFEPVTLPHCVARLSWQGWHPAQWQEAWIYRRHFDAPKTFRHRRVFLHFDGVMNTAVPVLNGHALPPHAGGYLPFHQEITGLLTHRNNVLALAVDARWNPVPPEGDPKGPTRLDYLEPGGIIRPVWLRAVPQIFLADVFARPADVLGPARRVDVTCTIDAAIVPRRALSLRVELLDGNRPVAAVEKPLRLSSPGQSQVTVTLAGLGNVKLWQPDSPQLYQVVATLQLDRRPLHDYRTRIGLREARFEMDGFFLNGDRFRLFGLDRHELYPYVGFAMPARVMRRDAEILRREFNCNIVRCSHYPQNPAFLDACDELGLMVWEETPGWQYLGDTAWQDLVVRDVQDMVRRDRNRPSVIIWGVRVNESRNDRELYARTTAAARALDDSRPASGSMTPDSRKRWQKEWREDVFAFDDYHSAPDGSVGIDPPLAGVPYLLAETVGQFSYGGWGFNNKYRRAGDMFLQTQQAIYHAQAHDRAAAYPRLCGVIAWCAFDYGSLMNSYNAVKCPGVADGFRIPKLGAAFYQAQLSPQVRPVIAPNFYWDFGSRTPRGPGRNAAIFSNCERLDLFINGAHAATVRPDREHYPHLAYPPFVCDLEIADEVAKSKPQLRIDGYLDGRIVLSRSFSSDATQDELFLAADDQELRGDGIDATRLVFKVVDQFGAERAYGGGELIFQITGPGVIVGDNPFTLLDDAGGVGAVWIRSVENATGRIVVTAAHSSLGRKEVSLTVVSASEPTV